MLGQQTPGMTQVALRGKHNQRFKYLIARFSIFVIVDGPIQHENK